MKQLKSTIYVLILALFLVCCGSYNSTNNKVAKEDPVVIANEKLAYEIVIIDAGFTSYLFSVAKPMTYYSQTYLQSKNRVYVAKWNSRAQNSQRYNSNIYENVIEYQANVDYGLEVNYKLYWYFKFAEQKYKMRLSY
ncbi:MAG: tRNA A22 N-methylase [Polaribacter sp.]|jgi:tRNA A22 N-methylase